MTCYDSGNGRTFILGRKYLSLERYFHKEIAECSAWYAQQSERGIKYPKSSKHIQRLYRKKQNAVKDYLHKVQPDGLRNTAERKISAVWLWETSGISIEGRSGTQDQPEASRTAL
ncbi:MAG: transposase [Lachnospiraceae bacterium]